MLPGTLVPPLAVAPPEVAVALVVPLLALPTVELAGTLTVPPFAPALPVPPPVVAAPPVAEAVSAWLVPLSELLTMDSEAEQPARSPPMNRGKKPLRHLVQFG
jgi:hypothetical protein